MTKTFADIIDGIRKAVLGVEVREDIAQGMEYVEQFAATATQKAEEAASSAEKAAQAKQDTEEAKDTAVSAINTAKSEATAEIEAARKNAADNIDSGKSSALTAIGKAKETGLNALDEKQRAALDSVAEAVSTAQSAAGTATKQSAEATKQAAAAVSSASAAAASQTAAKASETESAKNLQGTKEYFEQVRTITIGAQGWYATPEALMAAVPIGENGWWAVVGTTDTIWTWDSDTGAWVDTRKEVDLSDYLTQTQVKALLAEYAYSKTEADAKFALTADKISTALGYDPAAKITRLERMMNMDGKLVFSGAGVCTGGTTTMTIPSTVDYVEIVSAIPAMGRNNRGYTGASDYVVAIGTTLGVSADFGHAKVARGGSAAVALTGLAISGYGTLGKDYPERSIYFNNESADVSLVSVSFASGGTLSISGGSSANRFTVYGYQYL